MRKLEVYHDKYVSKEDFNYRYIFRDLIISEEYDEIEIKDIKEEKTREVFFETCIFDLGNIKTINLIRDFLKKYNILYFNIYNCSISKDFLNSDFFEDFKFRLHLFEICEDSIIINSKYFKYIEIKGSKFNNIEILGNNLLVLYLNQDIIKNFKIDLCPKLRKIKVTYSNYLKIDYFDFKLHKNENNFFHNIDKFPKLKDFSIIYK